MLLSWEYFSYQNKDLICIDSICLQVKTTQAKSNVAINSVAVVHNRLYEACSWIRITKTPFHYTSGTYVYVSSPDLPTLFTKH